MVQQFYQNQDGDGAKKNLNGQRKIIELSFLNITADLLFIINNT